MEDKPILSQSFTSIDKLTSNDGSGGGRHTGGKGCLQSISKRHVLAFYAFLGFFIAYTLRANLSVAIVEMSQTNFHKIVTHSATPEDTTSVNDQSTTSSANITSTITEPPEFDQV